MALFALVLALCALAASVWLARRLYAIDLTVRETARRLDALDRDLRG